MKSVIPVTHNGGGSCVRFLDYLIPESASFETIKHNLFRRMPGFGAREFGCCVTRLMLWSVVTAFGVVTAATLLPNAQADTGSFSVDSNQPRISPPSQSGLENSVVNAVAPEAEFADENGVDSGQYVLSDLVINRRDIFGSETAEANATPRLYRVIDALHVKTREKTILLETGLKPGQRVIASDVAELERNLRALGIFASVSVTLVPVDDNHAEIHIQTRDRLSVVFGAAGSFLGGIGQLGFTVGERNVNGSGDRLLLSYSGTTDGDLRGAIAYDDIHFINRHHAASYSLGQTDEGRFYQFQVHVLLKPWRVGSPGPWGQRVSAVRSTFLKTGYPWHRCHYRENHWFFRDLVVLPRISGHRWRRAFVAICAMALYSELIEETSSLP